MKKILIIFMFTLLFNACEKNTIDVDTDPKNNVITTSSMIFIPSSIICSVGDTIYFELGPTHNAVEVSESEYNNSGGAPLENGFNIGFGEAAYIIATEEKTYYYVCQPHLPQMKGMIIVN